MEFTINQLVTHPIVTTRHNEQLTQSDNQLLINLSDGELLSMAQHYGEEARKWKNKFLGLLPEIARRKLYEQRGFSSIIYFAKVVGGVSEAQVEEVLRLKEKLEATPILQKLLINGEVSMHKLERVASIAEPSNEEFLANQVQILSRRALDTLVKDLKQSEENSLAGQRIEEEVQQVAVIVEKDIGEELKALQQKGIDINEELRRFLQQRKREIEEEKNELAAKPATTKSRYIPAATKKLLKKEHGTKCAISHCKNTATQIHHKRRHALDLSHDPHYLAPLCKYHHEIAHAIDLKVQEKRKTSTRTSSFEDKLQKPKTAIAKPALQQLKIMI